MRILMTGATGLLGKDIGKRLVSQGHDITVLTRNVNEAKSLLSFPATILPWNSAESPLPDDYLNGVDVVINLAGESIAGGRWNKKRKALILDSRVNGTRKLVDAIIKNPGTIKKFISASAIGYYGHRTQEVSEDSTPGDDFLSHVCQQWEAEARRLEAHGINVVIPRIGIVLSKKGGALEKMLPVFSAGIGGAIGNGQQWMSWIHQDDLTSMFCFFVNQQDLKGAFNVVAPQPLPNIDFSRVLAKALGRGLFPPVPSFIIKIALGEMSVLVTNGQPVSARKVQRHGFQFKFPELSLALQDICDSLQSCKQELIEEIWLPKSKDEVFPFFCDEKNLETITPEFLNFKVERKTSEKIEQGTLIDYKLKLHGLPLKWRTFIEQWVPGEKFVDRQIKGPYKLWHHTHEFIPFANGTLMRDRVLFQLPFARLAILVAGPFVTKDVRSIFSYRRKVIAEMFHK